MSSMMYGTKIPKIFNEKMSKRDINVNIIEIAF